MEVMKRAIRTRTTEIVQAVRENLLRSNVSEEILKIVLFGSCARGQDRSDSDIDLMIIVRQDRWDVIDRIYDLITDLMFEYEREISLKVFSAAEYRKLSEPPTPFMKQVQSEGHIVYEREPLS
jgi:predicted nucleotidyltransferase